MFSRIRTLLAACIAPVVLVLACLSTPAPAGAATTTAPWCWRHSHRCFAAMTVNITTGHAFVVTDRATKRGAIHDAWARCQARPAATSCRHAGWVTNGYLAVVYRAVNGKGQEWASAIAYSQAAARLRAHNRLTGRGTRQAWGWIGTTRAHRYTTNGGIRRGSM
ncbi:hypothetical protein GCM10028801_37120 [Nocardioides maradonensis]